MSAYSLRRLGEGTLWLEEGVSVVSWASCVGKKEREGPLGSSFTRVYTAEEGDKMSFEQEEQEMVSLAFSDCVSSGGRPDVVFGGDLLNQCVSTSFAMRGQKVPFVGLYGACSTMAEGFSLASLFVASGAAEKAAAITSSHYCTAERQYRFPLSYGAQRPQTAQWTVTGSGSVLVGKKAEPPFVRAVCFGQVSDAGIKDANNMGAAMAPAAAETLLQFLEDTDTSPSDYDRIFTGDLGAEGSELLRILMEREGKTLGDRYEDCGVLIFDSETQDTHAGGSGCGCSASVLCGHILSNLKKGLWKKVLFMATGALMSPTTTLQGESISGIAHLLLLEGAN